MKLADFYQPNNNKNLDVDFHGASIVTASGKEIPITEQMLQHSFSLLIEAWEKANSVKKHM